MLIKFLKDIYGNRFNGKSRADAEVAYAPRSASTFKLGGHFNYECYDKNGNLKWKDRGHNIWVNEGRNYVLDVLFKNATRKDPIYIDLYKSSTGPKATWTGANFTVGAGGTWTVFTGYKGARKSFTDDAIGSFRVNNNTSKAVFSISAAGNIYGAFMNTTSVKANKTGTLLCADDFASSRTVASGDTVNVTYTVGADDDGV